MWRFWFFLICLSGFLFPVSKSAVILEIEKQSFDTLKLTFPFVSQDDVTVSIINEDVLDYRLENAKKVTVALADSVKSIGRQVARVSLYNSENKFINYFSVFIDIKAKGTAYIFTKSCPKEKL